MATDTPHRFFTWMRSLGIQREPGWIGGVASGIATRLGVDPLIVRGIIVVVAVLGGPALLLYAAAWLLLPDTHDHIHLEDLLRGVFSSAIAGIGVLVLLALLPVSQGFWFANDWGQPFWGASIGRAFWTAALIALAIWFVVWISRRAGSAPTAPKNPAPAPPASSAPAADFTAWREQQAAWRAENTAYRQQQSSERAEAWRLRSEEQQAEYARRRAAYLDERRRTRSNPLFSILVIGLALAAGGATTLLLKGGELEVTTVVAGLAVALGVLAVGIMVNGLLGRRPGGAAGLASILLVPLLFVTVFPQNDHFQYGNSSAFSPIDNPRDRADIYLAGGGEVFLGLRDYYDENGSGPDDVYLFVLSGDVNVVLPDDAFTTVDAYTLTGDVNVVGDGKSDHRGNSTVVSFNRDGSDRHVTAHIYLLDGTITVQNPGESE